MKQSKFALTAVAILAAIGGTLAYKYNRTPNNFYGYTTSLINGKVTGICNANVPVLTLLKCTTFGGSIATFSCAPATSVTTCTASVTAGL